MFSQPEDELTILMFRLFRLSFNMKKGKQVRRFSAAAKAVAAKIVNQPCTHLPDCVVFADHRKDLPFQSTFQGVLMFLDISGKSGG